MNFEPGPLLRRGGNERGFGLGGGLFTPAVFFAKDEVVAAEEDGAAEFLAQAIDDIGEALLGIMLASGGIEGQQAPETAIVEIGKLEGDEAQADAAFPGFAQELGSRRVEFRFQVGWFVEAFARLLLIHVVVADLDGQGADAFPVGTHFGHELIGHAAECGFQEFLVGGVRGESFLLAVRFGGRAQWDDGPFVEAERKISQLRGHAADEQTQQVGGCMSDLANVRQPGGSQLACCFGADTGQPFVRERR